MFFSSLNARAQAGFADTSGTSHALHNLNEFPFMALADSNNSTPAYLKIIDQHNDYYVYGIIRNMIRLGNSYVNAGNFEHALSLYRKAVLYCNTPGTRRLLSMLYNNIGNVYVARGNLNQGMVNFKKAINCAEQFTSELPLESLYSNISMPLIRLNQSDKALFYLKKAATLARQNRNSQALANIYHNMGACYATLNNLPQSKIYFYKAIEISRRYKYDNILQSAYADMGMIALEHNKTEEALSNLKKAAAIKGSTNPYYQNIGSMSLAVAYFKLKKYNLAEACLKKSLAISQNSGILTDLINVHKMLSDVYAATGRYELAFEHRSIEKALSDSISKKEAVTAVSRIETQYRTALKDKEIATKQLTIDRQKSDINSRNVWIGATLAGLLLLSILIVFQRKNYKHKQKLKNEQVRNLMHQQELRIMKAIMSGEEKERIRLARELHDNIMTQFSVVKMNLSALTGKENPVLNKETLKPVIGQLDEATENLRRTAHNLMPDMLLQEGLADAIYYFCNNLQKFIPFTINFQQLGKIPRFNVQFELSVYRIIQELIQNIIKHAAATTAIVQLSFENNLLSITVEDNGKGMAEKNGKGNNGLGIKSIYARVTSLNGRIELESKANVGTTVRMEFDEPSPGKVF